MKNFLQAFLLTVNLSLSISVGIAQNVGIGTPIPTEKLDVIGNINVSGTIKANGIDGAANQVLMKNSSGDMVWGDAGDYKNAVTFTAAGSSTWTVPAGVSKIRIEAWGGGGGGSSHGSGAGGGYVTGIFPVVAGGIVSYTIGTGGSGGINGAASSASYLSFFLQASGGEGDISSSTFNTAVGGSFSGTSAAGFSGAPGEGGQQNRFGGYQLNSTTFREFQIGGKGGDAGNGLHTGGKPPYTLRDPVAGTVIYAVFGAHGKVPGGGGGSGLTSGGTVKSGAAGMVIIHY